MRRPFRERLPDRSDSITRSLFQRAMVTMLIAELSGAVTAVIDSILAGRFLGGVALAASGLGGPYFSIASIVSGILMVGCTNLCTRSIGKGDMKELNAIFSLTVTLGVICSVLLGFCGSAFAGTFARLFGAGKASADARALCTRARRARTCDTPRWWNWLCFASPSRGRGRVCA